MIVGQALTFVRQTVGCVRNITPVPIEGGKERERERAQP